jgi:hypothetical protein
MATHYGSPILGKNSFCNSGNWLSGFAEKVSQPFVAWEFSIPDCSLCICWLLYSFTLNELLADVTWLLHNTPESN